MTATVVVGAGPAGCLVARRLADAGRSVVLIEAGPDDRSPLVDQLDWLEVQADPTRRWRSLRVRRHAGDRGSEYTRGKGLGGSGAINGMVVEVPPADHAMWGGLDVAASLARVLSEIDPVRADPGPFAARLLEMSRSYGWDGEAALLTVRDGRRFDASAAYLTPGLDVAVRAETEVERLVVDGGAVRAVELEGGDRVDAEQVILCAGAFETPRLLWRSGIDLPGLGDRLADHPSVGISVELRARSRSPDDARGVNPPVTALMRRGDCQLVALDHLGSGASGRYGLVLVALMAPLSVGAVSPGPISFDLLSDESDRERMRDGVRSTAQLLQRLVDNDSVGATSPMMKTVIGDQKAAASTVLRLDNAQLDRWILDNLGPVFHAAASCRIGDVIDLDGSVPSVRGLHVIDGSAFAAMPPVNPYLATLVLADAMAARLLQAS